VCTFHTSRLLQCAVRLYNSSLRYLLVPCAGSGEEGVFTSMRRFDEHSKPQQPEFLGMLSARPDKALGLPGLEMCGLDGLSGSSGPSGERAPTQLSAPGHATAFSTTTPMTTTTSVVIFATTPSLEQIQAARDLILRKRRLFLAYCPQKLLEPVSSDLPVPGSNSKSVFKDGDVRRLWEAGFQNVAQVARIELVAQVQERLMCPSRVPLARMLGRL
jgi:hypothetical protein